MAKSVEPAKGQGRRRLLSFQVFAAISLISFVYCVTVFVFLFDTFGPDAFLFHTVFFTFFAAMCFISFFAAVSIDPGRVPDSFYTEVEDPVVHKTGGQTKHCDRCSTHKPSRAHHCRVCKRCILKMDHHCVWINNCVGYRNYKPFIIFVLYATISSIYSMVIFMHNLNHIDRRLDLPNTILYVSFGSIDVLLIMILGSLLGWHIYLMSRNLTTIEYRGEVRAIWLAKKSGEKYKHPYNMGVRKNIRMVLGSSMLKWFWPLALDHLKDGTQFSVYHD